MYVVFVVSIAPVGGLYFVGLLPFFAPCLLCSVRWRVWVGLEVAELTPEAFLSRNAPVLLAGLGQCGGWIVFVWVAFERGGRVWFFPVVPHQFH